MDEGILFDQIKRKEADIINTLQNIAEAAFITESLQRTEMEAEDSEDVDSDLSKVASEIAKSTRSLMDDNSDPDFEDIIDDAVEINDRVPEFLETGSSLLNHSQENFPNKPQTFIKQDIMEEIHHTEAVFDNQHKQRKIPTLLEAHLHEEKKEEEQVQDPDEEHDSQEERGDHSDPGGSTGSWKIDYIRVETEEKNKREKKAAAKSEVWISKSKKEKSRKKHSSKRHKTTESELRKTKRKDSFSFSSETIASKLDKNYVKLKTKSKSKSSKKRTNRSIKSVDNWKDILKLTSVHHGSDLDQVLENLLDSYSPTVPRGTSQSCIEALSDKDLEVLPCPACKDRFFLPTSFFQHIMRKSIEITYNCKCCGKVLVFHNKCSLKIHILSHLESDQSLDRVETDLLDVRSLNIKDLRLNSHVRNFTQELSSAVNNINHERDLEQCSECFKSLDREELLSHFSYANENKNPVMCDDCQISLPTKCSYSAHRRIHSKRSPYVCPECGRRFYTWSAFRSHVLESCLHQSRVLLWTCPSCSSQDRFTGERSEVMLHLAESHSKQYWKCNLCPSAWCDKEKSMNHLREKHSDSADGSIKVLYKKKYKSKSLFFSSKSSLLEHLDKSAELSPQFMFSCARCEEKYWTSQELSSHLQASESCRALTEESLRLFPEEPEDTEKYRAIMDNLRVIQQESDCSSCVKYNENFQKHIEKHQRLDKESKTVVPSVIINEKEESSKRVTRLMKRSRSSDFDTGDIQDVMKIERTSEDSLKTGSSPPLKLKIRLNPEVSRAVELPPGPATPCVTPSVIPSVAPTVSEGGSRKEEKKGKGKGSKVKFSVPTPLVEPLGVDMTSGKDLILLNRLFHSPDAFFSGSVVRAEARGQRDYRCSHCDLTEPDRARFISHISQHKSCQSYFQCLECGTCFAAEPSWRKHLLLMHRIKDPEPHLYCQPLIQDYDFSPAEDEDEDEEGRFEFENSFSDDGNLVIDTGEEFSVQPSHDPTCLACGENFSSSGLFKEHKCGQSPFQGLKLR